MAFRSHPTWLRRPGLIRVDDVGNGMGILLEWEEANPSNFNKQIHYNIYYSNTRFGILDSDPKAITTSRSVIVNIPPGDLQYFAVRATEFALNTDIDITNLSQISEDVFEYPAPVTLLNDLPESQDAYVIEVDDVTGFPMIGELIIGTEVIRYSDVDAINNTFTVDINNRAIIQSALASHSSGDEVKLWHGVEDGNTIIRQGTPDWHQTVNQDDDAIGTVNADADGYRVAATDNLTTDLSSSDAKNIDFPAYDFKGYHRPSIQKTFSGACVGSYVGGEFNDSRGFDFQARNLARLDAMLQVTGEKVILLRRFWTGRRCKCISLRREHQRTRCGNCYGTGFAGGYERYVNTRAVSETETNTRGYIMVRFHPYVDDLQIQSDQSLIQAAKPTSWTLSVPTLKDRDVVIRFNEDGTEEFRYEVLDVTRNKLVLGNVGKQQFNLIRLDKTDIIYQYSISDF